MKQLNVLKLAGSFREISNALEIVSGVIRIFAIALMIMQSVIIVKSIKSTEN